MSTTKYDQVDIGDVIYELETDKVTMEVEAPDKGILSKILIPEGTEGVKVRETVAIITSDEKKETNIKDSYTYSFISL